MTGIHELGRTPAMSGAPAHVRVSVVGGRTQLDVMLPLDVSVASLLPELVKLVRSRDGEASTDTPWTATRDTFCVLNRLDPIAPLQPNETLRAAGVVDGELLHLTDERAQSEPTLYDDVVDAAARLNKAAYAGWDAAAARWMSFAGLGVVSLVWVYVLVLGPQRTIIVGLAAAVVAMMAGVATLAHRWYEQADVGAAAGWASIPISAAIVWVLLRGFGGYGVAAGCALLVVWNAACYRAIGAGRWGYLASGALVAGAGLAMLAHTLGVSARTVGVIFAVAAALACLTVSRLAGRLVRVEQSTHRPDTNPKAVVFETSLTPQPSPTDSGANPPSSEMMPTAEAVWARLGSAMITGSALYAGLAVSVLGGATTVLCAGVQWAALVFAGVCAAALAVQGRVPASALERVSLSGPAAALLMVGCVCAVRGTPEMALTGFATLLAVAMVAVVIGLRVLRGNRSRRWATASEYLQYALFAALIPAALWAAGVYAQL